ncbi:MAG: glycoside hydrolase family 97 protein [Bacteroidota bacterium]|nr:glycoside hydrolase family 97 protein [Bacteroidota bacterium]
MNRSLYFLIISMCMIIAGSCFANQKEVISPNGKLKATFTLNNEGTPVYSLSFKGRPIVGNSKLGFILKNNDNFNKNFKIINSQYSNFDETWQRVWGATKSVRNHYNQLKVQLQEKNGKKRILNILFRIYNDGLGFRYEVPEQPNLKEVDIIDECSNFQMVSDNTCWWSPGDWELYEHLFTKSKLSAIDCKPYLNNDLCSTYIPDLKAVNTPLTMKTPDGMYLSIHEASLVDYAGMTLHVDSTLNLKSTLVAWPDGIRVKTKAPFKSPWRTIQISENAGGLVESNLIENLNEPCKLTDTEWIKPNKYIGIWWEMHLGISSQGIEEGKPHGATTQNAKRYIDFASKHGITSMLIEGWNSGHGEKFGWAFDFTKPYPDFDIQEVIKYGKEKNVALVGQNETCAAAEWYDSKLDSAFRYYNNLGVHVVKTGYVGKVVPIRYYHHGQWMVNHYRRVIEKAAENHIMIISHEVIQGTGESRTYPNWLSRETLRGQEWEAWGNPGNTPEHSTIFPFTTMLGGSIDYTPGIFNIKLEGYNRPNNQVPTTLTKQLALYLTINSPMPMIADLPENYEKYPDAFKFIEDVPSIWQETKVLNGEIGEYLTIARKDKQSDNWFIGSITNQDKRQQDISLNFLDKNKVYEAKIYTDADNADWKNNPTAYKIITQKVKSTDHIKLNLASGGGAAISLKVIN